MELRHLRYFVAVAEELHFGRAAARIYIAQPALSRQIRSLEDELELRLFERDRRRVTLTPAGGVFLDDVKRLLEQLERAVESARRAARGERGTLRIAYVPAVAYTGFSEVVRTFRQRLPDVEVRLQETHPARQVQALLAGRVDIGFARGPIDEPALMVETVMEEPLVVALPTGHPLSSRRILKLGMLAREPFVIQSRSRGPGSHDQILGICRAAGFSPRVVQEGSQTEALSLVAAGVGVAIVPASLRVIRRSGVVYRPLREGPMTQLVMVWCKDAGLPMLREFLDEVRRMADRRFRAGKRTRGSGARGL
ncbi:MAG TPA: LysR family transcriptional regulator [Blastocatellia bacterium]|nr:LysR family transcriptional regulator [Blastocatellia bacterium]